MNTFFSVDSTPLVALHGWGMDASCWDAVIPLLCNKLPVKVLNLPGYAGTHELAEMNMDSVVDWLAEQFEGKCHLLAWSMGGLVAQAFVCKYPERVASSSFVGATPSFTQRGEWLDALTPEVLDAFMQNIQKNQNATLRRFIALQFMGESAAVNIQKRLRQAVTQQTTSLETLALGLSWLRECDYRQHLSAKNTQQHWMFGELDQLVPVNAGRALKDTCPDMTVSYFDGCAHAPHITQPERFVEKLVHFISQHTSK